MLRLDPTCAQAFSGRGLARARHGDPEAAIVDMIEAFRQNRHSIAIVLRLAEVWSLDADTEISKTMVSVLIEESFGRIDPTDWEEINRP